MVKIQNLDKKQVWVEIFYRFCSKDCMKHFLWTLLEKMAYGKSISMPIYFSTICTTYMYYIYSVKLTGSSTSM